MLSTSKKTNTSWCANTSTIEYLKNPKTPTDKRFISCLESNSWLLKNNLIVPGRKYAKNTHAAEFSPMVPAKKSILSPAKNEIINNKLRLIFTGNNKINST